MQIITQSEAVQALNQVSRNEYETFSIEGKPDYLGPVTVFFVRVWNGEDVEWRDVMFHRRQGKVQVYAGTN